MVWGILAMVGMFVAFLPCLGSLNWLNIPFSIVGLAISVVAVVTARDGRSGTAITGLVLCAVALVLGVLRLHLGGGIL